MSHGFSLFPPEILSGLMYTGPGAGPLLSAAAAWTGMSEELTTTATSVQSQITGLTSQWQGPAATAATAAAAPYVTWLQSTAAQAGTMATQATTAAALFEAAYSATVPPPVIAANRALLLALIATNFFGQNTPSIAATEAQYEAMWAQDVAANETYATGSEANIAALQQPSPPPQPSHTQSQPMISDPSNAANQVANAASQPPSTAATTPDIQDILNGLFAPGDGTGAGAGVGNGAANMLGNPASLMSYAMMPARMLMMLPQLARMMSMTGQTAGAAAGAAAQAPTALMTQIGEFVNEKMQGAVGTLVGHFNTATQTISAKLGQAASMGSLKVPQGWSMAADGMVRAAPVLPNTTVSAPVSAMSPGGMPGGPFGHALMGAMAGRGIGSVAAKAPKIIPRSPAGG